MRRHYGWLGMLAACGLVGATVAAKSKSPDDPLVVHEWGTFLSMNGSDGVTLDGMYHEEHALPDFVHARSRDQLHIRSSDLKGETPVIYFYTQQPRKVSVKVGFPQGVWTQWYPQAQKVGPSWEQFGSSLEPKQGHITWEAQILPVAPGQKAPTLPATSSDALWNYARDVDAAYVRTTDRTHGGRSEVERFLFYRGLRLEQSGLFPKEARAMVNTWRRSYFENDGIRVLYILPQSWTEAFLPMTLDPKPSKLVRVMVGRTELLTPEREAQATAAVRDLASSETTRREKAFDWLRNQGRYVEPILRQVLRSHPDARTETLCRRLLLTDFATTLRAASRSASGAPVVEQPYSIQSQLAVVLREMGLNAEAKQEGEAVLTMLEKQPTPHMSDSESRHYLRAYARAMEGAGDDAAAAQGYGQFITFASQVKTGCNNCHSGVTAPREMGWFRDWYAGRKFAECVARADRVSVEIAAQKAACATNRGDTAAQMKLAYLYQAQGKHAQAVAIWADLQGNRQDRSARTALR